MVGMVVSNPTAQNTTSFSGLPRAMETASNTEYTMRTSAPSPFCRARVDPEPGTFIRSPNVVTITPGSRDKATNASISLCAVTQTGHPGPDSRVRVCGSIPRIPWRNMAMVWVPHTSMNRRESRHSW